MNANLIRHKFTSKLLDGEVLHFGWNPKNSRVHAWPGA
jgi:hypothetical protein